jgi:hypothetical protein
MLIMVETRPAPPHAPAGSHGRSTACCGHCCCPAAVPNDDIFVDSPTVNEFPRRQGNGSYSSEQAKAWQIETRHLQLLDYHCDLAHELTGTVREADQLVVEPTTLLCSLVLPRGFIGERGHVPANLVLFLIAEPNDFVTGTFERILCAAPVSLFS